MQPVIIIGTQRSGSNLLRLMLNQHSTILAPHPPHILQTFFPLLNRYGNLNDKNNFLQLAKDVCAFAIQNPVTWDITDLTAAHVISLCPQPTLTGIYNAVYEMYATQQGATYWCCKSMANLYYIPQIEQEGLLPYYIHLVRDGRDVAASFKKTIVGEKHAYHLALQWKKDQDTAEKNCHQFAPDRYIPIQYEKLISDPENTLRLLMHRLKLEFEPEMMTYYETSEAKNTASAGKMWTNVSKPVLSHNTNKFLSQLTEADILIFESIAGSTLEKHGYTPYFSTDKWKEQFTPEEISEFDALNEHLKKEALLNFDPKGIEKRQGQDRLIAEISKRGQ